MERYGKPPRLDRDLHYRKKFESWWESNKKAKIPYLRFDNGPTILSQHLDGGGELLRLDGAEVVSVALILDTPSFMSVQSCIIF
jgi:hypothetical protein